MIRSKMDYNAYYKQDLIMSGIDKKNIWFRISDRRYKFYKSLRRLEYYINCKKGIINKLITKILNIYHIRLCNKYNWTIPPNVFGPGLSIIHVGTIVVSGRAKVGKNCRIHVCTNIGYATSHGNDGTPVIGDNVYIGPGAKIFGPIKIADKCVIGANAVVNKSFVNTCTIAGVPAYKISDNDSSSLIKEV